MYSVVDIEPVGLEAQNDGIVEMALVQVRGDGTLLDEFSTLVHAAGSSAEARAVHGIEDKDLVGSPAWPDVWLEISSMLDGTILVARNLDFEEKFLSGSLQGIAATFPRTLGLCTLQTARMQLEGRAYSLVSLHKTVSGHWRNDNHTALGDARDARPARIPAHQRSAPLPQRHPTRSSTWPSHPRGTDMPDQMQTGSRHRELRRIAGQRIPRPDSHRPRTGQPQAVRKYAQTLDRHLSDGILTSEEATELRAIGRHTALTGPQLRQLHRQAWERAFAESIGTDAGLLDQRTRAHMLHMADQLGLKEQADALREVQNRLAEPEPPISASWLRGTRVGIIGTSDELEALRTKAEIYGAQVAKNITKAVKWVATDDADVAPSGLLTARRLGIEVVTAQRADVLLNNEIRVADRTYTEHTARIQVDRTERAQRVRERDAFWRHSWRKLELTADPGPQRVC